MCTIEGSWNALAELVAFKLGCDCLESFVRTGFCRAASYELAGCCGIDEVMNPRLV